MTPEVDSQKQINDSEDDSQQQIIVSQCSAFTHI